MVCVGGGGEEEYGVCVCKKIGRKRKGVGNVNCDQITVTHVLLFFPSSLYYPIPKNGGYSVELPKPAYLKIREEQEGGGTRSPKYPSTVTKVT